MKREKITVILGMCGILLAGCGEKNIDNADGSEVNISSIESSIVSESKESDAFEEPESGKAETENGEVSLSKTEEDETGVYPESGGLSEITMGTYTEGKQTALCRVKLPLSYFMASGYTDEYGNENTMLETNGSLVSDIAAEGRLDELDVFSTTVVLHPQGEIQNEYTFAIVSADTFNLNTEQEYAPDGILFGDPGHQAYIYETSGQFDIVMLYELSEDWSLFIENTGDLKDSLALEAVGQEWYSLVTPIE